MEIHSKLSALRDSMKAQNIQAYIITGTDPHQSEYLAPHWCTREWISGFSGSAGVVVITPKQAGLWTDSRYFIQAEKALDGTGIELFRVGMPDVPDHVKWLEKTLEPESTVGVHGMEISAEAHGKLKKTLSEKRIQVALTPDLLAPIWKERPAPPDDAVFLLDEAYSGESRGHKLQRVRAKMAEEKVDRYLISSVDDIAWLLNLRGTDVAHNPVFLSHALVTATAATLFVREKKVPAEVNAALKADGVTVAPYERVIDALERPEPDGRVAMAPGRVCARFYEAVPEKSRKNLEHDITTRFKAVKNETELAGIRNAMVKDGVAMVRFMHWFYAHPSQDSLTELTAAEKLRAFRIRSII